MGQQRFRNRLAQDELAQNERRLGIMDRQATVSENEDTRAGAEADRLNLIRGNDQFIQSANAAGLLAPNMLEIDRNKLRQGIESGNATAIQFGLNLVNKSGELPEGSVAESIQPLPDGGYAITVRNKDGSPGGVTVDGSSEPNSEMVVFSPGKLANLGNLYYQTGVVSNSSIISPTIFRAQEGRIEADAQRNEILDRIGRKNAVLNAMPPGGARRAAASALSEASTPEEEDDLLTRLESDAGLSSQRTTPARTSANTPAPAAAPSTAAAPPSITERAYNRIKGDMAAVQAVGNGLNKEELTSLYAYSLRQGDVDTASRIEPYLRTRHNVSDSEIGSIQRQLAAIRAETGESTAVLPSAIARTASNAVQAAADTTERVVTAAGFGERAARERAAREASVLADIRGETAPETTSIAVQDPTAQAEVTAVAEAVQGRPTAAVDRDINAGRIRVSPTTAAAVSADLRAKGINDVQGLLRLNDRDRAMARAVILATEPNPEIRKQMSQEISNIFETGDVSLSRQEFEGQEIQRGQVRNQAVRNQIDRDTLNVRIAELRRNLFKDQNEATQKTIDKGAQFIEAANKIYFGENGDEKNLNGATAARFTNSIMAPFLYRAIQTSNKAEGEALLRAMSPALSTTVAALAAEEKGGVVETFKSFFRPDAVDAVSSTDFDLSRVQVEKKNGRPVRFFYLNERNGVLDEAIDASDLQDLNGQVYKIVLDAAEYNASRGK
jgi:hypothetical protein